MIIGLPLVSGEFIINGHDLIRRHGSHGGWGKAGLGHAAGGGDRSDGILSIVIHLGYEMEVKS